MKYFVASFTITCSEELLQTARELLADSLAEAGFESFEDTETGLNGYVQKELLDKEILTKCIDEFVMPDVSISYKMSDAEDKDWNETWENEGFNPIIVDEQLIIYDAKKPEDVPNHYPYSIGIDARLAFGTGTHKTTRMILDTLLYMELTGKRVLDCGCGTGILGIASVRLGASEVLAFDIDEWSVRNTLHNAELNGIDSLRVLHGDASVLSGISETFDVVLANINRNILLNDMKSYKKVMSEGATLIMSGFFQEDVPQLTECAEELGLRLAEKRQDGEWACIKLV